MEKLRLMTNEMRAKHCIYDERFPWTFSRGNHFFDAVAVHVILDKNFSSYLFDGAPQNKCILPLFGAKYYLSSTFEYESYEYWGIEF